MSVNPIECSNILIVEDEHALADRYAVWLSDSYTVTTVYTGVAALVKLDDPIDIVLLYRQLPGISGDEVLGEVKDQRPDDKIAIVSAVTPDFAISGLGVEDYLHKPVKWNDLRTLVDEIIKRTSRGKIHQELEQSQVKKSTLETVKRNAGLSQSDEYVELIEPIKMYPA